MNSPFPEPIAGHCDGLIAIGGMIPLVRNGILWALLCVGAWMNPVVQGVDCDRWVQRTDVGSPGQRYSHAMAYDEERGVTVFFGGELSNPGDAEVYFNDTWEYDGVHWRRVDIAGEVPAPRSGHAMTYDPVRRQVLMQGGVNEDGYLREFWSFESLGSGAGRWRRLPMFVEGGAPGPGPGGVNDEARAGHAMVFDRMHNQVLLLGGTTGADPNLESPGTYRSDRVWSWNGEAWASSGMIRQPVAGRWDGPTRHAMAFDAHQGILAISGGAYYYYGDVQDPAGWVDLTDSRFLWATTFTGVATFVRFTTGPEIAPFPGGRQQHAMVYDDHRRRFVLYGGTGDNSPAIGEDHYEAWATALPDGSLRYSAEKRVLSPRPPSRARHAMVYDRRRRVTVLVGGVGGARYDDTWELGAVPPEILAQPVSFTNGPCREAAFRVEATGQGRMQYLWRRDGKPLLDDERVQGSRTATLLLSRIRHADAGEYDVVVTDDCGPDLSVTSRVARLVVEPGLTWVRREMAGPPPRADAAMAYDPGRGVMVLFGGYTFENGVWRQLNDLWEYDGARWELRQDSLPDNGLTFHPDLGPLHVNSPGPGVRFRHRLAYDPVARAVVLFGGRYLQSATAAAELDDVWTWNGWAWTKYLRLPGQDWPEPRARHAMAWDPARERVVVFGGSPAAAPERRNIVWERGAAAWEGVRFTGGQSTTVTHDGASMAWDGLDGVMLSGPHVAGIGGRAAAFFFWDGKGWLQGPDAASVPHAEGEVSIPVADYGAMAFDVGRRRMVYFGGYYGGFSDRTFQRERTGWRVLAAMGPSGRFGHCMAYDTRRGVLVLFGGATDLTSGVSGETWELVSADLPSFDTHPADAVNEPGGEMMLEARAIGAGQLEYQWLRDGALLQDDGRIMGSRTPNLSIRDLRASDAGLYRARVSNECGVRDSRDAQLQIVAGGIPLMARWTADGVSLEWLQSGAVLEQSSSPTGPWRTVSGATSPFRPALLEGAMLYRLRMPNP